MNNTITLLREQFPPTDADQHSQSFDIAAGRADGPAGLVSQSRIEVWRSDNSFEYAEDGRGAHLLAVTGLGGRMEDVVAWFPEDPERWFLRRGVGVILGLEEVERCQYMGDPLHLYETPASWAATGGTGGAAVIEWKSHLPFWLWDLEIHCESERLARRLKRAINPKPINIRIRVAG